MALAQETQVEVGWAAIILRGKNEIIISGSYPNTTNNRMELTSVIEGLGMLQNGEVCTIFSDSKYVVDRNN